MLKMIPSLRDLKMEWKYKLISICGVLFRMATNSAAVRKWPHVDCCIAAAVNLHSYCSEEMALCRFAVFQP